MIKENTAIQSVAFMPYQQHRAWRREHHPVAGGANRQLASLGFQSVRAHYYQVYIFIFGVRVNNPPPGSDYYVGMSI